MYYRSAAGDKASDYEDIWGPDHNGCSSFKPGINERPNKFSSPDVIPHGKIKIRRANNYLINKNFSGNVISLNNNVLSPTESGMSANGESLCSTPTPNTAGR